MQLMRFIIFLVDPVYCQKFISDVSIDVLGSPKGIGIS